MDELDLSGKKYISAKRASALTGYAKDYVGQLARSGKISATRFGRAWYVEEASILAHAKADSVQDGENTPPAASQAAVLTEKPASLKSPISLPQHFYRPYSFPNTWSSVKYLEDGSALLPELSKSNFKSSEITSKNIVSSEKVDISFEKNVPIISRSESVSVEASEIPFRIIPGVNFDIPQPGKPSRLQPAFKPVPKAVTRTQGSFMPVFAMTGAALVLIASYGVLGASFAANSNQLAQTGTYTASALTALESVIQMLLASPYVQSGLSAIQMFGKVLAGSFWAYAQAGIDFIKGLI